MLETTRRPLWLVIAFLTVGIMLLPACSDDGGNAGTDDSGDKSAQDSGDEKAAEEKAADDGESKDGSTDENAGDTTESTTAPDGEKAAGGDFCARFESLVREVSTSLSGVMMESEPSPESLQALVDLKEPLQSFIDSAPADIADAVQVSLGQIQQVIGALDGVDLSDPQAVSAAFAKVSFSQDPEAKAAEESLSAYARDNCGFDPNDLANEVAPSDG